MKWAYWALVCLTLLFTTVAGAVEAPTPELGRTLFESTQLGTNGKSCSSCHPEGKGLGEIDAYDDAQLKEMINFCIRDALKGQMFASGAQELEALLAYLRSLPATK